MNVIFPLLMVLVMATLSHADETIPGHLIIIGGGLRPHNSTVYERLIRYAGGAEKARFGILPTASLNTRDAERFAKILVDYGISRSQLQIIDVTSLNADQQTSNPAIIEQINQCTAIYFSGGDQRRITRALQNAEGLETPALQAIRAVWQRGGVIAGSSAGAAAQAQTMITVSGLPDDSLDQGMDALDFGATTEVARRGVLVSRGLGFFRGGLIDQHFSQFRGRLGRLTRVAIESQVRYGFGIDENTALDVFPDGMIEVIGGGHVTIVDAIDAKCEDGPLGCRISNVRLCCLADGDRFDPKSGAASVAPVKSLIAEGDEDWNGNHPIMDIAGSHAVLHALFRGLGNNTRQKQLGYAFKRSRHYGHGYRFTFSETDHTRSYSGDVNGDESYSIVGVTLNIDPVALNLKPPRAELPTDIPDGASRTAIEALLFRGILLADDNHRFLPDQPITRIDLAHAISQTIHLEPVRKSPPQITDMEPESPGVDEVALVVGARLMELDATGAFRGDAPVTRREAATTLVRLSESYGANRISCEPVELNDVAKLSAAESESIFGAVRSGLLAAESRSFRPGDPLTRQQAATAIFQVIGFPWQKIDSRNRATLRR